MSKRKAIIVVDILAFTGLTLLVSTGILMEYLLPSGSGRRLTIWSMNRHEWGDIHFWVACFFFSVLVVHLVLHWRFIVSRFKSHANENSIYRVALGVLGLIGLLAIAVAPLLSPIEKNGEHQRDHRGPPIHRNR